MGKRVALIVGPPNVVDNKVASAFRNNPGKEYSKRTIRTKPSVAVSVVGASLRRLCKKGIIKRVRRGVYMKPLPPKMPRVKDATCTSFYRTSLEDFSLDFARVLMSLPGARGPDSSIDLHMGKDEGNIKISSKHEVVEVTLRRRKKT